MNTCIAEIAAQKSQTGGFGGKSGSFGNKGIAGEFETILAALLGGQSVVQSAAPNQTSQIESESASVVEADSSCENGVPGKLLQAQDQQGILGSALGGTSSQVSTIDDVCQQIIGATPQARVSGIAISLLQGQKASVIGNAVLESYFVNSGIGNTDVSGDGKEISEIVKADISQGWMRQEALPEEDTIASDLRLTEAQIDIAPNKISPQSTASVLEEASLALVFNRPGICEKATAGSNAISTPNEDAKGMFSTSNSAVQSRQILQGKGIDALLSLISTQNDSQESRTPIFLTLRPILGFPQSTINEPKEASLNSPKAIINPLSKTDSDEIIPQELEPLAEIDLLTSLEEHIPLADRIQFNRSGQGLQALQCRSSWASVLDSQLGATRVVDEQLGNSHTEFRIQGGTGEPSQQAVKTNIEVMWKIDSNEISIKGLEHLAQADLEKSSGNPVFLTDRMQFNTNDQRGSVIRIQSNSGEGLDSEQSASRAINQQVRVPFRFGVSSRGQNSDGNAFLTPEPGAISKAFDEIGSLNQNPRETALCHQIFDKVIDEIQKGIAVKNQASLRISTDDGKRIHVDISLVSNQVRARISVSDAELRDLLASHGWLLVHRFEANGLVAEQVEFSLLGEKQFGESRREKKWVWGQSSVDDLEEVGGDYETMVVNSSGFDSFA